MHPKFEISIKTLNPSFEKLVSTVPFTAGMLPRDMAKSGVYLFSEREQHLYVGRSRNIRRRYGLHTMPSAQHNQASFAFLLAKEALGITGASYKPNDMSRVSLSKKPEFIQSFTEAKRRILAMEFRFVEEIDPTRQALLEIYAAVALSTRYNSFSTH